MPRGIGGVGRIQPEIGDMKETTITDCNTILLLQQGVQQQQTVELDWLGVRSHPTVGVERFGSNVSDPLNSPSEEPAVGTNNLLVYSF